MIEGKGMSIWRIAACEGGNPQAIVQQAQTAGLRHVHIKVADGVNPSNHQPAGALKAIVDALKGAGVKVWGWHFLYGTQSGVNIATREADRAIQQIADLGLDGYALDFENTGNPKFSWNGGPALATAFMNRLRGAVGANYPIGAKSHALMFRVGTDDRPYQPQIPFDAFIEQCNVLIPQVYWVFDTPERRLRESYRQYTKRYPGRFFAPYGAAYGEGQPNGRFWEASPAEITQFMDLAQEMKFAAVAFYSWDYCSSKNPRLWEPIVQYQWKDTAPPGPGTPPPPGGQPPASEFILQLIAALNARDLTKVTAVYNPNAALVTARGIFQGHANIRAFYTQLLNDLPNGRFALTSASDIGPTTCRYLWTAASPVATIADGNDTVGTLGTGLEYHSMFYTLKKM